MMKSVLYLTCAIFLSVHHPEKGMPIEPGAAIPLPDATWTDVSGKEVSLNSIKSNNGLLVVFAGNHCPYMQRNQIRLHQVCSFAHRNNIGVVMVNSNEDERTTTESFAAMKAYAAEQKFSWHYIIDKKAALAAAFDAERIPECYLFDKTGRLVYKGAVDDNPGNADAVKIHYLQNAINEILGGKSVSVSTSSNTGCSIRRSL
ncbi:MAG TPA: redoxin family protein [Chitinophaga sp.]|uniref:redoxin family protein n=1 Tax=Chitinophaga sp. TaxID=1869181 RepID=UPI002BBFA195|nr:redoxin family protein [Chitinophaga sp.]HVI48259.1 redoxin family protein [Chitinophaga sp.]